MGSRAASKWYREEEKSAVTSRGSSSLSCSDTFGRSLIAARLGDTW